MAPSQDEAAPARLEEEEVVEQEDDSDFDGEEAPSHLPFAPPSELLDESTTIDPSYIISLIRRLLPHDVGVTKDSQETENLASWVYENNEMNKETRKEERNDGQAVSEEVNDPWEDCGCILWDLAASRSQAELMVGSHILEVLLANLHVSKSFRVKEICLGIIGNLACHEGLSTTMVSTNGLVDAVVDQLFLDDSTCLSETFRVLAICLQTSSFASWAAALLPDHILLRILWIIENTLNSTLLEKSLDFLLVIIDNQGLGSLLRQPLMKSGLSNLIIGLLASEIGKLRDEDKLERSSPLDLILRLIEAVSATDEFVEMMSSEGELFELVCGVVKLSDKTEDSCASAVVIIANMLSDEPYLSSKLSSDFPFLLGLIDILPLVSDDYQARDALWCILARLLVQIDENTTSISNLNQLASLLLDKSSLIEEDLDSHPLNGNLGEELKSLDSSGKLSAVVASLRRIACFLGKWNAARSSKDVTSNESDYGKAQKLLDYCHRYG